MVAAGTAALRWEGPTEGAAGSDVVPTRGLPHSSQNFCAAVTGWPQVGHTRGRGEPHSAQNFFPAGLGLLQVEQVTVVMASLSYHLG